ncbi:MAG TPA: DUF423 domain-containing protein, partial [Planctomycetaceae bacterium]|nr:DUF423 domain-containing protein [Planctomycetaceae bacterium]
VGWFSFAAGICSCGGNSIDVTGPETPSSTDA